MSNSGFVYSIVDNVVVTVRVCINILNYTNHAIKISIKYLSLVYFKEINIHVPRNYCFKIYAM